MKIATLVALLLVSAAYAQEPNRNHTSIREAEVAKTHYPVDARGIPQDDSPALQPKPLPVLHPSLAEIARANRTARANSQRAALTIETDDLKNSDSKDKDEDAKNKPQDK